MSDKSLIKIISTMQALWTHINHKNTQIQQQLTTQIQRRNQLLHIRNLKLKKIDQIVNRIQENINKGKNQLEALSQMSDNNCLYVQRNINKELQIPVPHYHYTYIINSPEYIRTLSEKTHQLEQNLLKDRQRRQAQITSLKIRISLAEIQLKQLKNRQKKT